MFAHSNGIVSTIFVLACLSASACDKAAKGDDSAAQTGTGGNGSVASEATPAASAITPADHRTMGPGMREHGAEMGSMGMAAGGHAHGGGAAMAKAGHHQ